MGPMTTWNLEISCSSIDNSTVNLHADQGPILSNLIISFGCQRFFSPALPRFNIQGGWSHRHTNNVSSAYQFMTLWLILMSQVGYYLCWKQVNSVCQTLPSCENFNDLLKKWYHTNVCLLYAKSYIHLLEKSTVLNWNSITIILDCTTSTTVFFLSLSRCSKKDSRHRETVTGNARAWLLLCIYVSVLREVEFDSMERKCK